MISLHGLTKRYRDKTAVDDLTLEITPGARRSTTHCVPSALRVRDA